MSIRTSAAGAIVSDPVFVTAEPIPSPSGLTHHIAPAAEGDSQETKFKQLIYWQEPKDVDPKSYYR